MKRLPPLWIACVPLVFLVALIACVVAVFGDETLSGASQIALLTATALCVSLGLWKRQLTWDDFEDVVRSRVGDIAVAMLILLLIGGLAGSWMVGGIVPTFIYYGLELLSPRWFLVSACIISAIVSVVIGSSWTTIATIGVALMGVGMALGMPTGWSAGAIISGAYFGDKVSPLSDTTVLASSVAGTPLFTHIRYMMYTTVPTFLLTLLIFGVKGIGMEAADMAQVIDVQEALAATFQISPWLLLVPLCTLTMILLRLPSTAVIFFSILLGAAMGLLVQGHLLDEISPEGATMLERRFRATLIAVYGSTHLHTGSPTLDSLVSTNGMAGMMDTVWLIICATVFGAAMTATGMVESIVQHVLRFVRGTVSLVAGTALTGIFLNVVCADQFLSIVLSCNMFQRLYQEGGYEPRLESRTVEDSATVTSVLIPWNTCGMTQSRVLGVSTFLYAPYCFFCYLSPLMTILMAATGFRIYRHKE